MRPRSTGCSTFLLLAPLAGCVASDPSQASPFAEAFPDPSVLLVAADVDGMRARLSRCEIPATETHHDALLRLLEATPRIDAEHLLLLTGAVAGVAPSEARPPAAGSAPRGSGRFAGTVDRLLLLGVLRLDPAPDRRAAGALLGRTQQDATLATLAEHLLPLVHDGGDDSLREILAGFASSNAALAFATLILLPRGLLAESLEPDVIRALAFEADRLALIRRLLDRRESLTSVELDRYLDALSFDAGRVEAISTSLRFLAPISHERLRGFCARLAFDESRLALVQAVAPGVAAAPLAVQVATAAELGEESARLAAFAALYGAAPAAVDPPGLATALDLAASDAGRAELLRLLEPELPGRLVTADAARVLASFRFDAGRVVALEVLKERLANLPWRERERLVSLMTFDSGKARARQLLEL